MAAGITPRSRLTLPEMQRRLAAVKSPPFRGRLAQNLAAEAEHQVLAGFRGERDPYGRPWAPLRHRKGKILSKTRRMANAVAAQPAPNGFRLDIPVEYAAAHQKGATIPPHSRLGVSEMFHDPKTGRLLKKSTRRKLVFVSTVRRRTFAKGITIPRRQMIPTAETGGLGPIWGPAFNKVAAKMIGQHLRGGGG